MAARTPLALEALLTLQPPLPLRVTVVQRNITVNAVC